METFVQLWRNPMPTMSPARMRLLMETIVVALRADQIVSAA
jgi:hypothetical protein